MTRVEIRRARGVKEPERLEPAAPAPPTNGAVKTIGPCASPAAPEGE